MTLRLLDGWVDLGLSNEWIAGVYERSVTGYENLQYQLTMIVNFMREEAAERNKEEFEVLREECIRLMRGHGKRIPEWRQCFIYDFQGQLIWKSDLVRICEVPSPSRSHCDDRSIVKPARFSLLSSSALSTETD